LRLRPGAPGGQRGADDGAAVNEPAALSPPGPLPILTFEEATLGPSLGYVFDARWLDPYESLVSMLWKFAWVNGLCRCANILRLWANILRLSDAQPTPDPVGETTPFLSGVSPSDLPRATGRYRQRSPHVG
jgi:hypothetical protein